MASTELTDSQMKILQNLVDLYREKAIKGKHIARMIDRSPGTIRNQIQSLKALQLVEGVPGPKGGYKPLANAYNALDIQEMNESESVSLIHNNDPVENLNVQEINLISVHHPKKCRAEIHVQGVAPDIHEGDSVTVGPTPKSYLVISGQVDNIIETGNILILSIENMEAPIDGQKQTFF